MPIDAFIGGSIPMPVRSKFMSAVWRAVYKHLFYERKHAPDSTAPGGKLRKVRVWTDVLPFPCPSLPFFLQPPVYDGLVVQECRHIRQSIPRPPPTLTVRYPIRRYRAMVAFGNRVLES